MKRYLAHITESIVNCSTLTLEAESPEALRRQIEEEGDYNPELLAAHTVEVNVEIVRELPSVQEEELDKVLTAIASKQLHIPTLERRWSDSLDFYDVSVWSVKDALKAAFEAGRKSVQEDKDSSTVSPEAEPKRYTYRRNRNGSTDTWDVLDPDGGCVVSIPFQGEPGTDKAAHYEARAKLIVDTLNLC